MYSQNSEEEVIHNYFKDRNTGTCLDIGAYDGKTFSNTHQLILNGWSGVMIEPSLKPFEGLSNLYRDNPSVTLINAAISPTEVTNTLVRWWDSNGYAVSTMNERHRDLWAKDIKFREYLLPAIHINAVYSAIGSPYFDFINLDVEGMNYEILKTLQLAGCAMICVEYENNRNKIIQHLVEQEFKLIHENSENLIMVR